MPGALVERVVRCRCLGIDLGGVVRRGAVGTAAGLEALSPHDPMDSVSIGIGRHHQAPAAAFQGSVAAVLPWSILSRPLGDVVRTNAANWAMSPSLSSRRTRPVVNSGNVSR